MRIPRTISNIIEKCQKMPLPLKISSPDHSQPKLLMGPGGHHLNYSGKIRLSVV